MEYTLLNNINTINNMDTVDQMDTMVEYHIALYILSSPSHSPYTSTHSNTASNNGEQWNYDAISPLSLKTLSDTFTASLEGYALSLARVGQMAGRVMASGLDVGGCFFDLLGEGGDLDDDLDVLDGFFRQWQWQWQWQRQRLGIGSDYNIYQNGDSAAVQLVDGREEEEVGEALEDETGVSMFGMDWLPSITGLLSNHSHSHNNASGGSSGHTIKLNTNQSPFPSHNTPSSYTHHHPNYSFSNNQRNVVVDPYTHIANTHHNDDESDIGNESLLFSLPSFPDSPSSDISDNLNSLDTLNEKYEDYGEYERAQDSLILNMLSHPSLLTPPSDIPLIHRRPDLSRKVMRDPSWRSYGDAMVAFKTGLVPLHSSSSSLGGGSGGCVMRVGKRRFFLARRGDLSSINAGDKEKVVEKDEKEKETEEEGDEIEMDVDSIHVDNSVQSTHNVPSRTHARQIIDLTSHTANANANADVTFNFSHHPLSNSSSTLTSIEQEKKSDVSTLTSDTAETRPSAEHMEIKEHMEHMELKEIKEIGKPKEVPRIKISFTRPPINPPAHVAQHTEPSVDQQNEGDVSKPDEEFTYTHSDKQPDKQPDTNVSVDHPRPPNNPNTTEHALTSEQTLISEAMRHAGNESGLHSAPIESSPPTDIPTQTMDESQSPTSAPINVPSSANTADTTNRTTAATTSLPKIKLKFKFKPPS